MCSKATRNLPLVRFTPLVGAQTLEGSFTLEELMYTHTYIHSPASANHLENYKCRQKDRFSNNSWALDVTYLFACTHVFFSFHVFQSSMVEDMPCLTYIHIHTCIPTSLPQRSNELEIKSSIDFGMYSHTYLKLCVCTSDLQELRQFDFFIVGCTDTYILSWEASKHKLSLQTFRGSYTHLKLCVCVCVYF